MNLYGNSTKPALNQLWDVLKCNFLLERPRSRTTRDVDMLALDLAT